MRGGRYMPALAMARSVKEGFPASARDANEEDGARCLQKDRGWLQMSWWHRVDGGS
jgi:hypothetical protein